MSRAHTMLLYIQNVPIRTIFMQIVELHAQFCAPTNTSSRIHTSGTTPHFQTLLCNWQKHSITDFATHTVNEYQLVNGSLHLRVQTLQPTHNVFVNFLAYVLQSQTTTSHEIFVMTLALRLPGPRPLPLVQNLSIQPPLILRNDLRITLPPLIRYKTTTRLREKVNH